MALFVRGLLEGWELSEYLAFVLRDPESKEIVGKGGSSARLRSGAAEGMKMVGALRPGTKELLWAQSEAEWEAAALLQALDRSVPDAPLQSLFDAAAAEAVTLGAVLFPTDWRFSGKRSGHGLGSPLRVFLLFPAGPDQKPLTIPSRTFPDGSIPSVSIVKQMLDVAMKKLKRLASAFSSAAESSAGLPVDLFGLGIRTPISQRNSLLQLQRMLDVATRDMKEKTEVLDQALDFLKEKTELVRLGVNGWVGKHKDQHLPRSLSTLLHSCVCDLLFIFKTPMEEKGVYPSLLVSRALGQGGVPAIAPGPSSSAVASLPPDEACSPLAGPSGLERSPEPGVPAKKARGLHPARPLSVEVGGAEAIAPLSAAPSNPLPAGDLHPPPSTSTSTPQGYPAESGPDQANFSAASASTSPTRSTCPAAAASGSSPSEPQIMDLTSSEGEQSFRCFDPLDKKVWRLGNIVLTARSFDLLVSPDAWLDDSVVMAVLRLIEERSREEGRPKVLVLDTRFLPRLMEQGFGSVRRWTRKVDVFAKDLLLVPVHLGVHWCMAVVDLAAREVHYFDSMGAPNDAALEALRDYVAQEHQDKKKVPLDVADWALINRDDTPQQRNNYDCGVFALTCADLYSARSPLAFTQDDMPRLRKRFLMAVMEFRLDGEAAPETPSPAKEKEGSISARRKSSGRMSQPDQTEEEKATYFEGLSFVLTSARRRPKSDSSDAEERSGPAFNKKQVRQMIEELGGTVVEDLVAGAGPERCFLVADTHYRTHKYLSALARAVPAVSHAWVLDSVAAGRLLSHKDYALPAGLGLESGALMEWHDRCPGLLKGWRVLVLTEWRSDPSALDFVQIWSPLVEWMGGRLVESVEELAGAEGQALLLTDASCGAEVLAAAAAASAPAVSVEWLIQAIITGQVPDHNLHPKYRYDFYETAAPAPPKAS